MINVIRIEKKAYNTLREKGGSDLPINLEKIAKNMKINVVYSNPNADNLSGALIRDVKTKILINSSHSQKRKRFTLAHEIGHYILHKDQKTFLDKSGRKVLLRSNNNQNNREIEANYFAAALLMPIPLLQQEIKLLKGNITFSELIKKLSKVFDVSEESIGYRLANLGYCS